MVIPLFAREITDDCPPRPEPIIFGQDVGWRLTLLLIMSLKLGTACSMDLPVCPFIARSKRRRNHGWCKWRACVCSCKANMANPGHRAILPACLGEMCDMRDQNVTFRICVMQTCDKEASVKSQVGSKESKEATKGPTQALDKRKHQQARNARKLNLHQVAWQQRGGAGWMPFALATARSCERDSQLPAPQSSLLGRSQMHFGEGEKRRLRTSPGRISVRIPLPSDGRGCLVLLSLSQPWQGQVWGLELADPD